MLFPVRGVARIFQRGGTHCVKVRVLTSSPDCHYEQDIVMAFSPPVVGCLVKKGLQKGGYTGTPGPPLGYPLVSSATAKIRENLKVLRRSWFFIL